MNWKELDTYSTKTAPPIAEDVLIWLGSNNKYFNSRVVMLSRIIEDCDGFQYEFIDSEGNKFNDVKRWTEITESSVDEL